MFKAGPAVTQFSPAPSEVLVPQGPQLPSIQRDPASMPGSFSNPDQYVPQTNPNVSPSETPNKRSFRNWAKRNPIAVVSLAGLTLIGAVSATYEVHEVTKGPYVPTTTTFPDTTTSVPFSPETDQTTGVIHTARLLPGEPYITTKRMNGEEIKVPKLRSTDDPNLFMESVMALFACGVGNADEQCLYQLYGRAGDNAEKIRQDLLREHKRIIVTHQESDKNPDLQLSIFDDPKSPAVFQKSKNAAGITTIKLIGGELYWSAWSSYNGSRWQGPETHGEVVSAWPVTQLEVNVMETPAGPEIKGLAWSYNEQHFKIPGTG